MRYYSLRNGDHRIGCHVAGKHYVAINPEITTVPLDHSAQDFDITGKRSCSIVMKPQRPQGLLPRNTTSPILISRSIQSFSGIASSSSGQSTRMFGRKRRVSMTLPGNSRLRLRSAAVVKRWIGACSVARAETARSDGVERLQQWLEAEGRRQGFPHRGVLRSSPTPAITETATPPSAILACARGTQMKCFSRPGEAMRPVASSSTPQIRSPAMPPVSTRATASCSPAMELTG